MTVVGQSRKSFGTHDLAQFTARMAELREELEPDIPTLVGDYVAYTDGACLGNPAGPGGWAAVVDGPGDNGHINVPILLWGPLSSTSNNRAEALGVLGALEWIPPGSHLGLHSDSELTVRVLQGRYKAKANPDIWAVIRRTISDKQLAVTAEWVRGHAGHPRNELADRLSKLGATDARSLAGERDLLQSDDPPPLSPADPAASAELAELAGLEPHGDWERDFLKSIARQLKDGRPLSPKQQAVINRIRSRGGLGSPQANATH